MEQVSADAGQIFVSTTDASQPSAVWAQGLWRAAQVDDPSNSGWEQWGQICFIDNCFSGAPSKAVIFVHSTRLDQNLRMPFAVE